MFGRVADEEPVGPLIDRQVGQSRGDGPPVPIPDRHVDPPDQLAIAEPDIPQVAGFEDDGEGPGPQRPGLGRRVGAAVEDVGGLGDHHDGSAPFLSLDSRMARKQRRRACW